MALIDTFAPLAAGFGRRGFLKGLRRLEGGARIQASPAEARAATRHVLPATSDIHTALYIRSLSRPPGQSTRRT